MELTAARLRELLHYDPETGIFTWRTSSQTAGSQNDRGYVRITIDGSDHKAHRLAHLYMTGEWPSAQIDHRSRVRDDNRWDNLRGATNGQNQANKAATSASGHKGVYWAPHAGMWRAELTLRRGGKRVKKVLGYFQSVDLAAEFRELAGWLVWGDHYAA